MHQGRSAEALAHGYRGSLKECHLAEKAVTVKKRSTGCTIRISMYGSDPQANSPLRDQHSLSLHINLEKGWYTVSEPIDMLQPLPQPAFFSVRGISMGVEGRPRPASGSRENSRLCSRGSRGRGALAVSLLRSGYQDSRVSETRWHRPSMQEEPAPLSDRRCVTATSPSCADGRPTRQSTR